MALRAEDVYAILKKRIDAGGATPEQIQQAVENYLAENPVSGMTDEQEQQLNQATEDILKKLDKNQGTENAGKTLVVGSDGNVAPSDSQSSVDMSLAIKNQASGAVPIIVTDSSGQPIQDLGMEGRTEQASTTGAQLFKPSQAKYEVNGVTFEFNNGSVTVHGEAENFISTSGMFDMVIPIHKATYFISSDEIKFEAWVTDSLGEDRFYQNEAFTLDGTEQSCRVYLSIDQGRTFNGIAKAMLNSGSEALPWEPYTGNQPSPSSDYPQEIINAGKYNEASQKWEYEVSVRGSQLWRNIGRETTLSGVKLTPLADGWINLNGTCTSSANIALEGNHLESGNYTISAEKQGSLPNNANALAQAYSPTGGHIQVSNNGFSSSGQLNEADDYQFRIRIDQGFTYNNVKVRVTLNEGLEALPYEPCRTPQTVLLQSDRPLTKWDRLEKRDGQWGWVYKSKEANIKEFTNWYKHTGFTVEGLYCYAGNLNGCAIGFQTSICDKFRNVNTAWNDEIGRKCLYSDHMNSDIKFFVTDIESLELWKTWVSQNDVNFVYETAEEAFIPLTAPEQSALNALHTNYPTTVLFNDQGCEMSLKYVADTKNYIDQNFVRKEDYTALEARVSALESTAVQNI